MPAQARQEIIDSAEVGVYHCIARCVRRAFLCGNDTYTGKDYSHRRAWIKERIEQLAKWMAIEIGWATTMQNHLHLILRNRPDLAEQWNDEEVIRRACKVFPAKFQRMGIQAEPTEQQLASLLNQKELVEELRSRLSDISRFMRQLCQQVAKRANQEDEVSGHFWQSRFRSVPLLDTAALVLCGMYVDLNQIRAGEAETPEQSRHTAAAQRIAARNHRQHGRWDQALACDGYLSPLSLDGDHQTGYPPGGQFGSPRASDKGLLPMSLDDYLQLLDWTGRQHGKRAGGTIPANLPPILERLDLTVDRLQTALDDFHQLFGIAVGTAGSLAAYAGRLGRRWLQKAGKVAEVLPG